MAFFENNTSYDVYSKKPFYEEAFNSYYYKVLLNTPIHSDYKLKSYLHSCLIFLEDNSKTERDRRYLLYNYLKGYFDVSDSSKLLNKVYALLPSSNSIISKIIKNICTNYNNPPARDLFIDNETIKELINDIINNSDYNAIMNKIEKTALIAGECIVRPYFNQDKQLEFDFVTPDNYSYCINEQGVEELWIHKLKKDEKNNNIDVFFIWTSDELRAQDIAGKNITEAVLDGDISNGIIKNQYGIIPYKRIFLNDSNNDTTNTKFGMIIAQLEDNRMKLSCMNNTVYNAFSMLMGINTNWKKNNITFGAGNFIEYNDVMSDMEAEPSVQEIAPTPQYLELNELRKDLKNEVFREYDIPNWAIDETANLQSGVAMELSRYPLIEAQKKNKEKLKQFDRGLLRFVCDVYNKQFLTNLPTDFDIAIDYIETQYQGDAKENYDINKQKWTDGVINTKTFLQSVTDTDDISTNEEAIEIIDDNISNKANLSQTDSNNNAKIEENE